MASAYLSKEAEAFRLKKFTRRLADEAIIGPDSSPTWPPESDFWGLPESIRLLIFKELNNGKSIRR